MIVAEGYGQRIGTLFFSNLDYEILQGNGSAPKKKIVRASPCFLHLKILLKSAFLGDMKQWWSRH
jgi:hypothetical protein